MYTYHLKIALSTLVVLLCACSAARAKNPSIQILRRSADRVQIDILAVDDEGFIYVADERNRRIQKFAP